MIHRLLFPVEPWNAWCELAAIADQPPQGHASAPGLDALFCGVARPLSSATQALELCRFWAEIALLFSHAEALETRPDWMLRALRALETEAGLRLRAGWSLLLQAAHVSPGHLCREWKKSFGATPTQWINARRLENAAGLLLQSNLPIKEISARCGFENLTYFYRLLQAKYGSAPRIYRRKSR